jgi:hypothetical protein
MSGPYAYARRFVERVRVVTVSLVLLVRGHRRLAIVVYTAPDMMYDIPCHSFFRVSSRSFRFLLLSNLLHILNAAREPEYERTVMIKAHG